jgi:hypothetical protein
MMIPLLDRIPKHKDKRKPWKLGGELYTGQIETAAALSREIQ